MANEEHVEILRQGLHVWNKWRDVNPDIHPDLSGADLIEVNFNAAKLAMADARGVYLGDANLNRANLTGANLTGRTSEG